MTPVVRFYWLVVLLALPASLFWLLESSAWQLTLTALSASPLALSTTILLLIFAATGVYDLFYSDSNLRKNFPVFANLRYLLESIRPEIRQYFIASNLEEAPFNREARDLIYRRAKKLNDTLPFGTEQNITAPGYLTTFHSIKACSVPEEKKRVLIGNSQCKQPYSASILNISGMSFGALSGNAIRALNLAAARGGFFQNTGEGSISSHHVIHGGDLVWQIGTGYFGCRNPDGSFNDEAFAATACTAQVKMIEVKLSQGAKPSHGGVLPGVKVTPEIARIRLVEVGKTVESPACHPAFDNPLGMMQFLARLRQLSKGKPVGFKLCIGKKSEFMSIVKAMLESGIFPDFITIDGAEGGTGAAPVEFSNRVGMPCLEATYFVHQVLTGAGIRDQIKIISAGKTATGFDILCKIALGADAVNSARAMMLALGCIQSKSCNTNKCPTGVATQDPVRAKALNVETRAQRVVNLHEGTIHAFFDLCGALGYNDPELLLPSDLHQRCENGFRNFDQIYTPLSSGQLLTTSIPDIYLKDWQSASSSSF
ncbi:MAG: FMN-binding glutamate synthase family protein [Pseudomonadales bacterium]|nr:FMN-binding glutamate synthase family protein [Pseudomonadales bacterium]